MIDTSVLKALAAAGATADMIIAAVEAAEAAAVERRRYEAERKAAWRAKRKMSHNVPGTLGDVPGTSRDITGQAGTSGDPSLPSPPSPFSPHTPHITPSPSPNSPESTINAPVRIKNATRLSSDWQPSDPDLQAAAQRGLVGADLRTEIEKFRNYWHAKGGRDAAKRDWSATWRNWVIGWSEKRGTRLGNHRPTSNRSDFLAGLASLASDRARDGSAPGATGAEIPRGRREIDG